MNILAFDTSTNYESIALSREGSLCAEYMLHARKTHSERLLPTLDLLLKELSMKRSELDGIAVSIGPGSFTGLRIGLATAKGLCLGLGIPLYTVSTLKILANNCAYCSYPLCAVIDAGRGEVYAAIFTPELDEISAPALYHADELLNRLKDRTLFIGNIPHKIQPIFKENPSVIFARDIDNYPKASSLIDLVFTEKMDSTYHADDLALVEPLYIRRSAAEEKYKK